MLTKLNMNNFFKLMVSKWVRVAKHNSHACNTTPEVVNVTEIPFIVYLRIFQMDYNCWLCKCNEGLSINS